MVKEVPFVVCILAISIIAIGFVDCASPTPSVDCSTVFLNMADCLSYVSSGSTVSKPQGACCNGLKTVLNTKPECLCQAFSNSAQFGFTLNQTKAAGLPAACGVSAPAATNCGLSGSAPSSPPGPAPSAPVSPPVPSPESYTTAKSPAPAPVSVSESPAPVPASESPSSSSAEASVSSTVGSPVPTPVSPPVTDTSSSAQLGASSLLVSLVVVFLALAIAY
uniref:Bifunctional inhibitor/plant lipid transfer protein/seed storage helical domain-containing protein n=1 Tax=Nelumbo nucifera TaxID=4432 RepID=A0A822XSL2_NELNU|nr:TPA_asm: hypothetical protein HUJ06_023359 [Nelumbo nucifera]